MVFMGADGVEGNKPLGEEAEADIAEMKRLPESYKVGIFVEKHGDGLPVRHYTKGSGWKTEPVTDTDPSSFANGIALTNFLEWALKEASHTEPDNSLLVLWGHSYRFAIGHTSTHAGIDPLDFAETLRYRHPVREVS